MGSFNDYINVIKSGIIKPRIQIEWLRVDETTESIITSDILDGSLSVNRNNGIRRTMDFTIRNTSELLPNIYGIWINKKVKLSLGVVCPDGTDFFIPQGVFVLLNPSYESSPTGTMVTFNAVDKFSQLTGDTGKGLLKDIYQINNGTSVNTGLKAILSDFGDKIMPNLYPNSSTFPYTIREGQDGNAGAIIEKIAYFMSYNCYYDRNGVFTTYPDIPDENKGVSWDYNFGDEKYTYLGATTEYKFTDTRNTVIVIGANINGLIAKAKVVDDDLASPTNVNLLGEIPHITLNDYIQTTQQATDLANFILRRLKILNKTISINSIPIYHINVDDIITITDSNFGFNKQRFLVTGISMGLGFGADMSVECIAVDEVDFTVGKVG